MTQSLREMYLSFVSGAGRFFTTQTRSKSEEIDTDRLFDGDDTLFKGVLATTRCYGEYGCGQSTIWVAKHTECSIVSVDTSSEWISKVEPLVPRSGIFRQLIYIDLGPLGSWGMPETLTYRSRFLDYVSAPWRNPCIVPDTILIDGRFRIGCFLYSLIHAPLGTKIIFDDYAERPFFHIAQEFCEIVERCGRQVLFVKDIKSNVDSAIEELPKFLYVRE